jgi:hypothetical protein
MIKRGGENIVVCSVRVSLVYIHIYGRDCVYQSSMLWCGCVAPLLLLLFSHSLSRGPPPPTKSSLYPGWDRVDIKWKTGDGGWVADEELLG